MLRNAELRDAKLLFEWRNEEECRRNSFHSTEIPFEEHQEWFRKKLQSKNSWIFIYEIEGRPVGQARLDCQDEGWVISYSIDKNYRMRGYGTDILKLVEQWLKEKEKKYKLYAYVKEENIASQKIFEKLGYEKKRYPDHIAFYKCVDSMSAQSKDCNEAGK